MNDIWKMEQAFWLKGIDFFEKNLAPQALMVLPGMGTLDRAQTIESLRDAPRWSSVDMNNRSEIEPSQDVRVIAYNAAGRRDGAQPYMAWCSSTYALIDDSWLMVQHQQTPEST